MWFTISYLTLVEGFRIKQVSSESKSQAELNFLLKEEYQLLLNFPIESSEASMSIGSVFHFKMSIQNEKCYFDTLDTFILVDNVDILCCFLFDNLFRIFFYNMAQNFNFCFLF